MNNCSCEHCSCDHCASFTHCVIRHFAHIFVVGYCPTGKAWVDKAVYANSNPTAHADAECSNAGSCDAATGTCICYPGYTGVACQRGRSPFAHSRLPLVNGAQNRSPLANGLVCPFRTSDMSTPMLGAWSMSDNGIHCQRRRKRCNRIRNRLH